MELLKNNMENIIVTEEESFKVSDKDLDLMLDALENPPKLSENLVNAAKVFKGNKGIKAIMLGEPTPKIDSVLFNQEEHDKALLADKRVRKMFFEEFASVFYESFLFGHYQCGEKDENDAQFKSWFSKKLKELE